jgi:hypothetical protein
LATALVHEVPAVVSDSEWEVLGSPFEVKPFR